MDYFPLDESEYLDSLPRPGLRLFLDSADAEEWRRFLPLGTFYGVTTNPLLLERSGRPCTLGELEKLTRAAAGLGAVEIHLQTWGRTSEEMVHNGGQLALMAGLGIDVVVKVPATESGFLVARQLAEAGCPITLTAIYKPGQVLLAAGFEAAYAAPYLGRMNDLAGPGEEPAGEKLVLTMHDLLRGTDSFTRLLVASLRSAEEVVHLAGLGLDTFTFGGTVAGQLFEDVNTQRAAADFQRAAEIQDKQEKPDA